MFEKAKPVPQAIDAQKPGANAPGFSGGSTFDDDLLITSIDSPRGKTDEPDDALRVIEWGELTARLNAARDLRRVLRCDVSKAGGSNRSGFADAAACYFRTRNDEEPNVNPVALEHLKGSSGMMHDSDQTKKQNNSGPLLDGSNPVGMR